MVKKIISGAKKSFDSIKDKSSVQQKKITRYIDRKPFVSFFIALGILLLLIVISNILGTPKIEEKKAAATAKKVQAYNIGKAPRLSIQAQIEKSGVIRISALAPGVVQTIFKQPGEYVVKGETLVGLSSNYQGGNTFSLQRQLAQAQYQNIKDTYDTQKEVIEKQKEAAEKNHVMAEDLKEITEQSLGETRNLISLNEEILTGVDQNISQLESTNIGGANDSLILSTKQLKAQFLAATNAAKQGLRQAEYNAEEDNAPAELADLQKNMAIKQLDIQEKMLNLNKEVARIQLNIAQVSEAMMYPGAPFTGTVQRVFVKVGQPVNPGTELMIITSDNSEETVTAIAHVSAEIAGKISKLEESTIQLGKNQKLSIFPSYVTQEPIQGSLYGVYFNIPNSYNKYLSEKGFVTVELPVGYFDTGSAIPYLPIDAVYQTKEQNYVFLVKKGKAEAQTVELGPVYGGYVEIVKGLNDKDVVILDRNVIAGDKITTQ